MTVRPTVCTSAGCGQRESGVSPSEGWVSHSVAPWLRNFSSIHSRNVGSKLVWDDVAHSCYHQVTAVKIGYPLTSTTLHDLIAGSSFDPLRLCVFEVFRSQVFNWAQAQDYFLIVHEISCVYEPAAGLRNRKFSLFFLHLTTTKNFDLALHSHVLVTLYVPFLSQIGQNLTGEFMRKIFEASGNLFTDCWSWQIFESSYCVLTVLLHWIYKIKYICYQESFVIHGWRIYWVFDS